MPRTVTIGSFSRMTYLSATTLRHYHAVGLLEPARVDEASGYRYYTTDQVPAAHLIRRLRGLDMPVDDVRSVLAAHDPAERDRIIAGHLAHMERRLAETAAAVASLRSLLTGDGPGSAGDSGDTRGLDLEIRSVATTPVWAITGDVRFDDFGTWIPAALRELIVAAGTGPRRGAPGALYPVEVFEAGIGTVTAFLPHDRGSAEPPAGRITATELPAATLAVTVHQGPLGDLDRTYGALGTVVAERGIGVDAPVREHFLARDRIEVAWPVVGEAA